MAKPIDDIDDEDAKAATDRWEDRANKRKNQIKSAKDGDYKNADTTPRLAKRMSRLKAIVQARLAKDGVIPEKAPAEASNGPAAIAPSAVTNELFERVLFETRDFLSIEFFERGLDVARSVGRVTTMTGPKTSFGTGFLVGNSLLMTNNHVLRSTAEAKASTFQLDYEANTYGPKKVTQEFNLDPDRFFLTDVAHDFTIVAVDKISIRNRPLTDYPYIPLSGEEGKITLLEAVSIIQHPNGIFKQIVVRDSKLLDLPDEPGRDLYFHYSSDTEPGSSGAPVFNDQWELVALHHKAVAKRNMQREPVDKDGQVIHPFDDKRVVYIGNEGIRVSRIVAAVKAATFTDPAMGAIRDALIKDWALKGQPGAPLAGGMTEGIRMVAIEGATNIG